MGKITKIRGHYEKLSNQERLKLMANAVIRNDDDEIKALQSSTPKKTYLMPDAWLYDRYHALWRISVMYWLVTEESLRKENANIFAAAEAIRQLAIEVELSPDELLAHVPPDVRERMALSGPLDSKMVDQYYSLFSEYWPGLEGNDRECA